MSVFVFCYCKSCINLNEIWLLCAVVIKIKNVAPNYTNCFSINKERKCIYGVVQFYFPLRCVLEIYLFFRPYKFIALGSFSVILVLFPLVLTYGTIQAIFEWLSWGIRTFVRDPDKFFEA